MKQNTSFLHFSALEFFFWATFAAYYPYLVIFLDSKGLNNMEIGTILSINACISIFAQPFWGIISDKIKSIKKVFILLLFIAILCIGSLPIYEGVILLGIVFAVITFFESALPPLLDSWVIMAIQEEKNISYGSIRLWGSIGFALMVYVFGKLMEIKGISILFLCYSLFGMVTIVLCSRIGVDHGIHSSKIKNIKISKLLMNYEYSTFLIFSVGIFIPYKAAFAFLPRLVEAVGGSKVHLGISLSVMALSEVPLFLFLNRFIHKVKPIFVILFSTIFFILRQYLFSIASSPIHIIFIQGLQGLSFGVFLTGAVYYIYSLAPQELKATAQTFGSAVYMGIGGIIGNYGGGWVIDHYGLKNLYHLGGYLSLGITILFILSIYFRKMKKQLER
ncbi:MFS transporter [Crassaminicella thermophila]|uniref:MFS transporter n=1 Tax=Crassaminicella thermophila TaxID=2599308 RepID=A0A5C0SGA0_CRATE|nr:MFS transporter [Crassaminicella thermophila]QEK13523.1 MFS transporter [Crassaminicella thermophila]